MFLRKTIFIRDSMTSYSMKYKIKILLFLNTWKEYVSCGFLRGLTEKVVRGKYVLKQIEHKNDYLKAR